MTLTRSVLKKVFPNDPRAIAEFERLDALLDAVSTNSGVLSEAIQSIQATIGDGSVFQTANDILASLSGLPNRVGAVEFTNDGSSDIRPIDGQDPASLLSRGTAYSVLVGIGGTGTTAQRPTNLPAGSFAIYHDTTLGKPIFFLGSGWVDATGASV